MATGWTKEGQGPSGLISLSGYTHAISYADVILAFGRSRPHPNPIDGPRTLQERT